MSAGKRQDLTLSPDPFAQELPPGDADFSLRWARIKQAVTRVYTDLPFARKTHSASRTLRPLMTNA